MLKHSIASPSDGEAKQATLTVRIDKPVQGCSLEPYTLLVEQGRGGKRNVSRARIVYRWQRSATKRVCSYPHCPQAKKYPFFALATMQSPIMPRKYSLHCSTYCLKECWKMHRTHSPPEKTRVEEMRDAREQRIKGSAYFDGPPDILWSSVSMSKNKFRK